MLKAVRSGFVSIIGRPNVGKSHLLNRILGEKTSIVSEKAQTTRNKITGIKTLKEGQIIFIDTPGIYDASSKLGRFLVEQSYSTYNDVDLVLFVTDAGRDTLERDRSILTTLKGTRVVLAVNKVDLFRKKDHLLEKMAAYRSLYEFEDVVPISAKTGENIDLLLDTFLKKFPEGPLFFPEDMVTDQPEKQIMAEFVREKIFLLTSNEIPYSSAVVVDSIEPGQKEGVLVVSCTIFIERESQKGIIIGKKGKMLKEIGTAARKEIERRFGSRVVLNLFVKLKKGWTKDSKSLYDLGYQQ
ncbi:MAG: GTPase Era [Nitrospinota bacterium]